MTKPAGISPNNADNKIIDSIKIEAVYFYCDNILNSYIRKLICITLSA